MTPDTPSATTPETPPPVIALPVRRRKGWPTFLGFGAVAVLILAGSVWGLRLDRLMARTAIPIAQVVADSGFVEMFIVESGTLESANNITVKCQVEALIGLVGGSQQNGMMGGGGRGGMGGGRGGAGGVGGGQGGGMPAATGKAAMKGAVGKGAGGMGGAGAAGGTAGRGGAGGGAGGGGAMGGGGGAGGGGAGGGSTAMTREPVVNAFTIQVAPYVPRGGQQARTGGGATASALMMANAMGGGGGRGGGGGGGGRGGGGGGGGGGGEDEKPGSTRIITILPEGTPVRAGDVVCELDAAAFKDELSSQVIRYEQAKSSYKQVQVLLDVSLISKKEFEEGILPQDRVELKDYIISCKSEIERLRLVAEGSDKLMALGKYPPTQARFDKLALQRAEMTLSRAQQMQDRLERFTAPKLLAAYKAKIEAIKADLYSQESALRSEEDRVKRLQRNIDACSMRAPRDGVVVYVNVPGRWGQGGTMIQEGATVRQGQPIFNLPDSKHMRVRVRVNETKMAYLRTGQATEIRIDAFPGRPLRGVVAEVTATPAQGNFMSTDIKAYDAMVNIDTGGFEGLKPGMSAEVAMFVERRQAKTRLPIQAIRWVGDDAYVAKLDAKGKPYWHPVELGLIGTAYVEVVQGLTTGESVALVPDTMPSPERRSERNWDTQVTAVEAADLRR